MLNPVQHNRTHLIPTWLIGPALGLMACGMQTAHSADTTPNAFSFDENPMTVDCRSLSGTFIWSPEVTITGVNSPTPVTAATWYENEWGIHQGDYTMFYAISGSKSCTNETVSRDDCKADNGDRVKVAVHVSYAENCQESVTRRYLKGSVLNVGGVEANFKIRFGYWYGTKVGNLLVYPGQASSEKVRNHQNAARYCDGLTNKYGVSDWRLPTKSELWDLHLSYAKGSFDTYSFENIIPGRAWTSERRKNSAGKTQYKTIRMSDGDNGWTNHDHNAMSVCVAKVDW
jgi:Protein of unknown function (DUF1566)